VSYQDPITVRQWGAGEIVPLTLRENDEGDFEFASDPESVNAEIVITRDDAPQVAEWLLASLEPIQ
jgi:hypothetical protein